MKALALEGGGVRGSYQVGAYQALLDLGYHFDCVTGTSIGAFNGAMIASNHFEELKSFWDDVNVGDILNLEKDLVDNINDNKINFEVIKDIFEIIKNKGIDLTNLRKKVTELVNEDDLRNSKINYGLVTVKRKHLQPIRIFKKDIPLGKLHDYIVASCYLPVFKKEKLIDGNYYMDGGFHDVCPVTMLIEQGYSDIFAIRVKGYGIFRKINRTDVKITYIEPSRSLGSILSLDINQIRDNYKMGYYDTMRLLKLYDGYKYSFKSHGYSYFKFLNRHVPKPIYRRVKSFFNTNDEKETTIKALEYMMNKNKMDFYQIYNFRKVLKQIKKSNKNDHFIVNYLQAIKLF